MTRKLLTSQKIVEAAAALFHEEGFHEVSMDRVAERAGITKVTVYQHFPSKEALLANCLQWRIEQREAALNHALRPDLPPQEALLSIFSFMEANARKNGFLGCAFQKATSEVAHQQEEIREIARNAKQRLRDRCSSLAQAAGCLHPDTVGIVCALLIDGAQALSLIEQSSEPFRAARLQARHLIDHDRKQQKRRVNLHVDRSARA